MHIGLHVNTLFVPDMIKNNDRHLPPVPTSNSNFSFSSFICTFFCFLYCLLTIINDIDQCAYLCYFIINVMNCVFTST